MAWYTTVEPHSLTGAVVDPDPESAQPMDPVYVHGTATEFRCGDGGSPRCEVMLPTRTLCDAHRQELHDTIKRARMGKKRKPKTAPTAEERQALNADRAERDTANVAAAKQQREERRSAATYHQQVTAEAAERREADAHSVANFVRAANGRPVSRGEMLDALGLAAGGRGQSAVKRAKALGLIGKQGNKYIPTNAQEGNTP